MKRRQEPGMKQIVAVLAVMTLFITLIAACAGTFNLKDLGENKAIAIYTAETVAIPIGYYAAQDENVDLALREVYNLAVEGKLTPEGVNRIIAALDMKDPLQVLLIKRTLRLAELFGASVVIGEDGIGTISELVDIDPDLLKAVANGYIDGFDTYKLTQAKFDPLSVDTSSLGKRLN